MTGREHEAQEVVADVVVDRGVDIGLAHLLTYLELATQLLLLALEPRRSAQSVDRAVLCGGHEPGARVVRDARLRPLLECGDEGLLREVLGQADVADDPRETGDEPGRLDPPDRVDRAMGIGGRHGQRPCQWRRAANYSFAAACSRMRSSWSLSSGVSSSPKSAASNTWRISISASPSSGLGQRLTHSIASSLDFT